MKKLLIILVSSLSFMTLSQAEARNFFGIRFGFPELGVQIGSTTVFGRNVGGRLTADFGYYSNAVLIGGDILYYLTIPTPGASFDLDFYVGGGLGVGFTTNNNGLGTTFTSCSDWNCCSLETSVCSSRRVRSDTATSGITTAERWG
ncbi:MAG: hypothetical protein HC933_08400 [Pleurocapsa sp. SU_196_0]|nr:hypothetical protein [Pleurocapsa sp. SU_196_0]